VGLLEMIKWEHLEGLHFILVNVGTQTESELLHKEEVSRITYL